jgi:hypothetical protein
MPVAHRQVHVGEGHWPVCAAHVGELDPARVELEAVLAEQPGEHGETVLLEACARIGAGRPTDPQRHLADGDAPRAELSAQQRRQHVDAHRGVFELCVDAAVLAALGGLAKLEVGDSELGRQSAPLGLQVADCDRPPGHAGEPGLQIVPVAIRVREQHTHRSDAETDDDDEHSDDELQCAADGFQLRCASTSGQRRSAHVSRAIPPAA